MRPQIGAWNQEGQVALGILHGFQVMSHGRDKIMGAAEKCRGQQVPCLPDSHLTNQCHSMMFRDVPFMLVITTAGILLFQRCPEHRRQWRQ